MRKYICVILIAFLVCLIFTGCNRKEIGQTIDKIERFKVVKTLGYYTENCDYDIYIIVDTQTNVEYLYMERDYRTAITVLLNSDGTPMLWYGE